MDSASVFDGVEAVQGAFRLLASLQLLAAMWPPQAVVNDGDKFDFIVVGAGTAGSVVASRLTEDEAVRVLLVEAGGDPPLESDFPGLPLFLKRSQFDWNYTTVEDHNLYQCHQQPHFEMSLGKMLGGSSSLNYMIYTRGPPSDYDSWAKAAQDTSWEWNNVLEYFKKSERLDVPDILATPDKKYHGTNGYMGVTKETNADKSNYLNAFKELGNDVVADVNPDHPLGYTDFLLTISDGHRQSSATSFLSPAKDRPNLHVLKNTLVTKVIFEGKRAVGVEALTSDGKTITIKAENEIVISAGVVNSPKILMLSGIGPKEHLTSMNIDVLSDLPVGENLQDHIAVAIVHNMEKLKKPFLPIEPRKFPAAAFKGFVALNKTQKYPDYMTVNYFVSAKIVRTFCAFAHRLSYQICDEIYETGKDKISVFSLVINVAPKSRGKVLLHSRNATDPPWIYPGYFSDQEDIEKIVDYVENYAEIVNSSYYRRVNAEFANPVSSRCAAFTPGSREYWRCYSLCMSSGTNHFTSTCAMGSVLDGRLKVLGVEGLRVADASVMPTIPRANPAATVVMIGEKAAVFIKEEFKL